jgi:hypothetical protein
LANESEGGGVVVVLSDVGTKQELEEEVADLENDSDAGGLLGTRVVVRSGSPLLASDLRRVSSRTARAIIVLGEGQPQVRGAYEGQKQQTTTHFVSS